MKKFDCKHPHHEQNKCDLWVYILILHDAGVHKSLTTNITKTCPQTESNIWWWMKIYTGESKHYAGLHTSLTTSIRTQKPVHKWIKYDEEEWRFILVIASTMQACMKVWLLQTNTPKPVHEPNKYMMKNEDLYWPKQARCTKVWLKSVRVRNKFMIENEDLYWWKQARCRLELTGMHSRAIKLAAPQGLFMYSPFLHTSHCKRVHTLVKHVCLSWAGI
jgi:hypothetical protein